MLFPPPGPPQRAYHILGAHKARIVPLQMLRHKELQPEGFGLPKHDALPLVPAGQREAVHLVEVGKGVCLIAQERYGAAEGQGRDLLFQLPPVRAVAQQVQVHVRPGLSYLGKNVHEESNPFW